MPNHVTQILSISANEETRKLIKRKVCSPANEFDANRIVAMPEILRCTLSNSQPSPQKDENIRNFGFPTWYEWANYHWGTKWGCYDAEWTGCDTVYFLSAWSPAIKIILALSVDFPEAHFTLKWSDEGGPCGIYEVKDGKVVEDFKFDYDSEEAKDLRIELGVDCDDDEE